MIDPLHFLRLHMQLECVGLDAAGQLVRIPGPFPDTVHRVYVARHDQGDSLFFRADVPMSTRKKLMRLPIADFFESPQRIQAILAEDEPVQEVHIGKSYRFPAVIPNTWFSDVIRLAQVDPAVVRRFDPDLEVSTHAVFGVLVAGEIVSACESSRENEFAGEAWVRTKEGFRQRGYARQVTAAWAAALKAQGIVPFYSHKWENLASQAVAQSLGLIQYIADAGYA